MKTTIFTRGKLMRALALSALGMAAILGGCTAGKDKPVDFDLSTTSILAAHTVGGTACPQILGTFDVTNNDIAAIDLAITAPAGLEATPTTARVAPGGKTTITVRFTCAVQPPLTGSVRVHATMVDNLSFNSAENVTVNVSKG